MSRTFPKHIRSDGQGYMQCARSGMLRKPSDMIKNDDGLMIAKDYADITPGFGTSHPQDSPAPEIGSDPTPVSDATGVTAALTKEDLQISDQEIEASLRENRFPRRGF